MPILSAEDRAFFQHNGYVIIPKAVPLPNLESVIAALWAFLGMDPGRPDDWCRPPLPTNGMVELYQHQALWDNRQHPRVHQAFAEILGTERLWVSFDRVNLKPPRRADLRDEVQVALHPVPARQKALMALAEQRLHDDGGRGVGGQEVSALGGGFSHRCSLVPGVRLQRKDVVCTGVRK